MLIKWENKYFVDLNFYLLIYKERISNTLWTGDRNLEIY